jgi:hypothetical protein
MTTPRLVRVVKKVVRLNIKHQPRTAKVVFIRTLPIIVGNPFDVHSLEQFAEADMLSLGLQVCIVMYGLHSRMAFNKGQI